MRKLKAIRISVIFSLWQAQLEANQRAQMQIAVELRERAERAEAEVCVRECDSERARENDRGSARA